MSVGASPWTEKGATLSDKSAIKEFKLSQQDIYAAMKAGKLQFKESWQVAIQGTQYLWATLL